MVRENRKKSNSLFFSSRALATAACPTRAGTDSFGESLNGSRPRSPPPASRKQPEAATPAKGLRKPLETVYRGWSDYQPQAAATISRIAPAATVTARASTQPDKKRSHLSPAFGLRHSRASTARCLETHIHCVHSCRIAAIAAIWR